jgi:hypothetical protein
VTAWSWLVPLVGAAIVFAAVLLTTPPGFAAIGDVLFSSARGPNAEGAAYALGAAASLALMVLVLLWAVAFVIQLLLRARRNRL